MVQEKNLLHLLLKKEKEKKMLLSYTVTLSLIMKQQHCRNESTQTKPLDNMKALEIAMAQKREKGLRSYVGLIGLTNLSGEMHVTPLFAKFTSLLYNTNEKDKYALQFTRFSLSLLFAQDAIKSTFYFAYIDAKQKTFHFLFQNHSN